MKSWSTYDDTELIRLFQTGEEPAFNLLFERYRNRIFNYLAKVTKSRETAEEATLDIFLKIWKAKEILHEVHNFEGFLFRIMQNQAIDCLRRAQKSKLMQQEIWNGIESLMAHETADEKILTADAASSISWAIGQLSPQRKEVFRLSREEYLSYDEIAQRMDISPHTVRNHIAAALKFIRGHLDDGTQLAGILLLTSRVS